MRNLIKFISLYNYSITFFILLFVSGYFLVNENFILKTKYFNSSNYLSGTVFYYQSSFFNYFKLEERNINLERENKRLSEKIIRSYSSKTEDVDSTLNLNYDYVKDGYY
jgi:rod shape-determining protein MreC